MNNLELYMIGSFAAFLGIAACVLLTKHLIDTRRLHHCEECGEPLKRSEWGVTHYSGISGKPDRWERWAWCSTQASYRIPRPPLLHELGATVPDDDDFEVSHNTMLEHRGGGF